MSELLTQNKIPKIYAYQDSHFPNCLKVGYTTKTAAERVAQQYPIKTPTQTWEIVLEENAIRKDGSFFTDFEIHKRLSKMGFKRLEGEWFEVNLEGVKSAILSEINNQNFEINRQFDFKMRPEQQEAVKKTAEYFRSIAKEEKNIIPHFLWNAKMRFGKTFAAYQLALKMNWSKVLVLTFKPAVLSAWREDLQSHIDFKGWQFASNKEEDLHENDLNPNQPFVYFASFQDVLGKDKNTGGIKIHNEWIHATHWDCVIFDEYHFGAWRDKSKDLFKGEKDLKEALKEQLQEVKEIEKEFDNKAEFIDYFDEDLMPITTNHYLYLSGTPFRAIGTGEFIEEQIFNWTYTDEQKAKEEWKVSQGDNPYLSLPKMVMLTYQLPENIQNIAIKGEFNEFDLNEFFKAKGNGKNASFIHENEVQKWLDFIRGQYLGSIENDLKSRNKAPMPFSDARLIHSLQHTFWFMPNVASCYAMKNLLEKNPFFSDYKILAVAGTQAGTGVDALPPVENAIGKGIDTKTITISCGKLTTGVSVKPWTGIFVLRNLSSPETYFQAVFRVQTPWVIHNPEKDAPNKEAIIKEQCYVFDFAPTRALSQVATYSNQLDPNNDKSQEQKVAEFIKFLPILAYDGSAMEEIDAGKLLDIATSGTTATLLARRWESALLVNVDNITLQRLMKNEEAMNALMSIEGFRSLNSDLETIINKSEAVKKAKKEATENDEKIDKEEKKKLSQEEKEAKSLRKQIQEKLIKFATRIPIFMYLSEYREQTLKDVITKLEPDLFKKVTGLSVSDFELLEKIGVFNGALMNDAVFKFKRYEDSSLNYTGINTYDDLTQVGGYNATVGLEEYRDH
ncbi:restriction endonuclease [Flavobacteriaceae bacterium Ap0902]|nr:restriction endonuclease [Flavobacteriaceae bacterium Ap0902]